MIAYTCEEGSVISAFQFTAQGPVINWAGPAVLKS